MENYMDFDPRSQSVFCPPEQKQEVSNANPNIYRPLPENSATPGETYYARIRIVNNVHNMKQSIIEKQTYFLKDTEGTFSVDSPLSIGDIKGCPIFNTWKTLRYTKVEEDPKLVKLFMDRGYPMSSKIQQTEYNAAQTFANGIFDKSTTKWCIIQVTEDENHPELVGKFLFWKLPKFIWNQLQDEMNPTDKKKFAYPMLDWFLGREIELVVKPGPDDENQPERKKREINYQSSKITTDIYPVTNIGGEDIFTEEETDIINTYTERFEKAVLKERNAEKRAAALDKLRKEDFIPTIQKLYNKCAESLKSACPDIVKELQFHYVDKAAGKIWEDDVQARVKNFCDRTLKWEKPDQNPSDIILS